MVKHVIIWTLKEMAEDEKLKVKKEIKESLESLKGVVQEIKDLKVVIDNLPTSTGDLMLDSTFETIEDLASYQKHPSHVAVANEKVRPWTANRSCLDFEID